MIDFKSLGYKDITKDKPITLKECIGECHENVYPYDKRFCKQEGDITIEVMVGNHRNIVFISGICYYPGGWQKFEVIAPKDFVYQMFTQTLIAVKFKISYNMNIYM